MSRTAKPGSNKITPQAAKPQALTWKERILPEDYDQLKSVFDLFDEDHSGLIDP
jgi:Ca2+-binding EF-hand superfamily protein